MPSFTLKDKYITKSSKNRLYKIDTPIIGLTGGIATGKSTTSKILSDMGYLVIDADKLVKLIYNSAEAIEFVSNLSPECIKENVIDFKRLREVFYHSDSIKNQIESFIYPRLRIQFLKQIPKDNNKFIFYDAPILFERGLDKLVDQTLLIYSPAQTQINRLVKRDSITIELAKKIMQNQLSIEKKKNIADLCVSNTKDIKYLESELLNILDIITV